jgi:hypothetical protein
MDGDFVAFEVSISPTPTNNLLPIESAYTFPVEIATKKGWKADFSVGPTFFYIQTEAKFSRAYILINLRVMR